MNAPRLFLGMAVFIILTAFGCSNSANTGITKVHETDCFRVKAILSITNYNRY